MPVLLLLLTVSVCVTIDVKRGSSLDMNQTDVHFKN